MNLLRAVLAALVCLVPAGADGEEPAEPSAWERSSLRWGLVLCPPGLSWVHLRAEHDSLPYPTGLILNPDVSGHLQVGAQFGERFAVYHQLGYSWGVSLLPSTVGTFSFGVWSSAAVFEVTLFRVLQFAVGPSLFVGQVYDSPSMWDPYFSWPNPVGGGGVARLNLVLPPRRFYRHWGFTVGVQGQFAQFDGGQFWDVALSFGFERF